MNKTFQLILTAITILFSGNTFATTHSTPPDDYEKLWRQVENFNNDGLPKSALTVVDEIYNLAISENNEKQIVKSIVYKMSYVKDLEEDGMKTTILQLESEINKYSGIVKPFMHLFLARMYELYYSYNSYLINQRSITLNFENQDLDTWDKTKFQDNIIKNYLLSIDDILKKEKIEEYSEFITYTKESKGSFPTLYDFVSYYSVTQLDSQYDDYRFNSTSKTDKLKDNNYLSDLETFIKIVLPLDTLSYKQTALSIYQKWLEFRLENSQNTEALVYTDLHRLSFVKRNLVTANSNDIWEEVLTRLQKKYTNLPELAHINWLLAEYYNMQGELYDFQDSTTFKYKILKIKAVELLQDVISRFPNAKYYAACYDLLSDIEEQYFDFIVERVVPANEKIPVKITYRNAEGFSTKIYSCNYEKYLEINESRYSENYLDELLKVSKLFSQANTVQLSGIEDYQAHYTEYLIELLPYGFYVLVLETKTGEKYYNTLFSSDLSIINKGSNRDNTELIILNRKTGLPVENAKIEFYRREFDSKISKYVSKSIYMTHTDKNGFAKITFAKNQKLLNSDRIDVSYKNDFLSDNIFIYSNPDNKTQKRNEIVFYTDRAIYRPGQTVHFKGICLEKMGNDVQILPNFTTDVFLKDVNWQNISNVTLTSNEYGTISGSFTIPLSALTGNFTIFSSGTGSCSVKVEEYKRPTFEVKTLPVEGEYKLNDNVTVEGEAITYSGTALTDVKGSYTVARNSIWKPWYAAGGMRYAVSGMRYYDNTPVEVAFGEVVVDNEGKFKIDFKAVVDEIELLKPYAAFNFTVNITITDINGETQTTSTMVLVANRALELFADVKPYIIKEQMDSIQITAQNVSGIPVAASIDVNVYKLKDNTTILSKKTWEIVDKPLYTKDEWYKLFPGHEYDNETEFSNYEIDKKVFDQKINTEETKKITFTGIDKWTSGIYRMVLTSVDKWGNKVEDVQEFVLFSEKDKKMPALLPNLFYMDKTSAQPGETVNLFVGSSYKNVYLFYYLEAQGKIIKEEKLTLNSEIKKVSIPIEESYRGDVVINMFFVKEGKIYKYNQTINVDWDNKKLDIKLITYRDKTLPGANENWKLKISDYLSKPAQSELMATMYDASLDMFAKNSWSLNLYSKYSSKLIWNGLNFNTFNNGISTHFSERERLFKDVNPYLFLFDTYGGAGRMKSRDYLMTAYSDFSFSKECETSVGGKGIEPPPPPMMVTGIVAMEEVVEDMAAGGSELPTPTAQIRSNFAETAFFYPSLTTDESGELFLNFTMPESVTRWNFMGLAHTKELEIGTITQELVTQKELMIMPNLPRFFRENDKITISAKINNVTEFNTNGIAKIEFFDVETLELLNDIFLDEKEVNGVKGMKGENEISFRVEKKGNTVVEWQVTIPEGFSAVGVRIIADGRNHYDGEERILPILSNKMLVTESLPLPVRKAGTQNFIFNSLIGSAQSNTMRQERFTLEYTSNPAWYAVQALPFLMDYPYECAEQTFSRYYANALSSHIANSNPKIKRVFELWKMLPESGALLSNLEKNEELKALLIEETPWLLNAKNESERKQQLGILFDLNRLANESSISIKKLSEIQSSSGGFPWFKGMNDSWYITQHIVGGFGHLYKLGVMDVKDNSTVWEMVKKAIQFIDKELARSYEDLKKHCDAKCLEKENLGYMQIQYLYVRSFFINDIPVSQNSIAAFDYYKSQAVKYWTGKDVYMQGMIALALYKYGEPKVPAKIVASLKERALKNDEMGMYWKFNNGCFWYQAPIETQALLIEVFSDITNDKTAVEEMKVWLLKQKQTTDWKTTKATAEAVYALLLQGEDLLADTDFPVIKIGNTTIDVASEPEIQTEAGTGYFKKHWEGSLVTPEWGKISVTKKENSVSWGAVYWQYFEQLDKIKKFEETPLKINKQLFVERRENDKLVIIPINVGALHATPLQVGEKVIVRIEIRCDRDMEYVHLSDKRAACFEPIDYISGYRYKAGLGYYQAIKDASMNFFIDYLRKGTYVFEYALRVSQKGDFSNGITTMQSMYAPEFSTHSEGVRVVVE